MRATYSDRCYQARVIRVERRLDFCVKSLFWLGNVLGIPASFDLRAMIRKVDLEGSASLYYPPEVQRKSEGGVRIILTPKPDLMVVQGKIHDLLMRTFDRHPNTFGYMGGSCLDVAQRHVDYPSTLKFDVQDAFFQVAMKNVRYAIRGSRYIPDQQGFSGSVSYWIAKLCTYYPPPDIIRLRYPEVNSFLPQGAPTSPVLFHLACRSLDEKLTRVAERVGGVVSRYADNYYFSIPSPHASKKLEQMVVGDAMKRGFPIHKVRRVHQGELCRILGYNLKDGGITNTRDFNRNLRGALYVLQTKLDRGLEWHEAYARVRGYMGVAVNTPDNLREVYEYCKGKIVSLSS